MSLHGGRHLARVAAFAVAGLDLWFNSSDHIPPHFHARKPGTWEIRVFFLLCTEDALAFEVKWPPDATGPNRRERDALLRGALDHRVALLLEWEQKVIVKEKM